MDAVFMLDDSWNSAADRCEHRQEQRVRDADEREADRDAQTERGVDERLDPDISD